MRFANFLKMILLLSSSFLWLSCSSWEDVVAPNEFQPLKFISVSPDSAKVGDNIIITGENFLKEKDLNIVWFTPQIPAIIDSATNTQLFLKVPNSALQGSIIIANALYSDTSDNSFTVLKTATDPASPVITDFSPKSGISGTVVTLTGQKFGFKKEDARIFFGNIQAEIITITDTLLKVRAPFNSKDVQITMNVNGKTGAATGVFKTIQRKHTITAIYPESGYPDDQIFVYVLYPNGDTSGINARIGKFPATIKAVKPMPYDSTLLEVRIIVPDRSITAPVYINFYNEQAKSESVLQVLEQEPPVITSFSPIESYPGASIITVTGENFGKKVAVKLSGGIELIVPSNNNQFSFFLPIGAKTGKICIETTEGKVACSNNEFKVLKGVSTTVGSLGGLKVISKTNSASGSGGGQSSSSSLDTVTQATKWNLQRCRVDKMTVQTEIAGCLQNNQVPYSDEVLQCLQNSSSNHGWLYHAVKTDIDSVNMIIRTIIISQCESGVYDDGTFVHYICKRFVVGFSNIPYTITNGKITVNLTSKEIKEHITKFEKYDQDNRRYSWGGSSFWNSNISFDGIYEVLPDAYFELTLE